MISREIVHCPDPSRDVLPESLPDWLKKLEAQHPVEIELGLERVGSVARAMGLTEPAYRVVTVAGTNGKGSVVAALEQILLHDNVHLGVYTSPHMLRFNERVRVDGVDVSDEQLCHAFAQVERARGCTSLTYFEFTTLAALVIFSEQSVEIAVLEVGLGGRLDAVNILDAEIAVITSIDIDHVDWLGSDRDVIGGEKAGILRAERTLICADRNPPDSVRRRATELNCSSWYIGQNYTLERGQTGWFWHGTDVTSAPLHLFLLGQPGLHADSVAAAIQVSALLERGYVPETLPSIVAELRLPGRAQRVQMQGREVWLDVAHNPAAVEYLFNTLLCNYSAESTIAVFAAMSDKDIHGMIAPACDAVDYWYVCDLAEVPRAYAGEGLAEILTTLGVRGVESRDSVSSALSAACQTALPGSRIVVFGSFFTVAAALAALEPESERLTRE